MRTAVKTIFCPIAWRIYWTKVQYCLPVHSGNVIHRRCSGVSGRAIGRAPGLHRSGSPTRSGTRGKRLLIFRCMVKQHYPQTIQVLPGTFQRQDQGIALPRGSPLREPICRVLLQRVQELAWQGVLNPMPGNQYGETGEPGKGRKPTFGKQQRSEGSCAAG